MEFSAVIDAKNRIDVVENYNSLSNYSSFRAPIERCFLGVSGALIKRVSPSPSSQAVVYPV